MEAVRKKKCERKDANPEGIVLFHSFFFGGGRGFRCKIMHASWPTVIPTRPLRIPADLAVAERKWSQRVDKVAVELVEIECIASRTAHFNQGQSLE